MVLSAILFGTILGTFGGLSVERWAQSGGACDAPITKRLPLSTVHEAACSQGGAWFVVPGVVLGIALCSLWTWWMLNRSSTAS